MKFSELGVPLSGSQAKKWRVLAITSVAIVLSLTTWFSATAVLPELRDVHGLSPRQSGWLTNAVQLGFVMGALVSSLLSIPDRYPLTKLMALASLSAGLFNLSLLAAPSFVSLLGARFLTGISLALIYPPAMKFIATWFLTGRGLAMGAMVGALTLGSALPHLLRAANFSFDWQMVILVSSIFALIGAVIFGIFSKEGPHPFGKTKVDPRQITQILRNRPVMLANLGYFGHMWELYAMWGWILAYISAARPEDSLALVSALAFGVIALGAPSSVLAGLAADRFGRPTIAGACMVVSGLSSVLIGFAYGQPLWVLGAVIFVWGFTVVADSAQFSAMVTEFSDQSLVGTALTFQMGVGFLITVFTVWLVPVVVDLLGSWRWSFLVLAPGPLIGVIAMLKLRMETHKGAST